MFQRISQLQIDKSVYYTYLIREYAAVDPERNLVLSTTRGRTRNARRWFVHKLNNNHSKDWDAGKVTFRAWDLDEALERLNEPRIKSRVAKLAQSTVSAQKKDYQTENQ